jgi:hypothetical protein
MMFDSPLLSISHGIPRQHTSIGGDEQVSGLVTLRACDLNCERDTKSFPRVAALALSRLASVAPIEPGHVTMQESVWKESKDGASTGSRARQLTNRGRSLVAALVG